MPSVLQPTSESSDAALLAEVMVVECVDVCEGVGGGIVLLVIVGNPLTGVDMQLYLAVVEKVGKGENPRVVEIINLSLVVREEVGVALRAALITTPTSIICLPVCLSVCWLYRMEQSC